MGYMVSGQSQVTTQTGSLHFAEGQLAFLPPHTPYRATCADGPGMAGYYATTHLAPELEALVQAWPRLPTGHYAVLLRGSMVEESVRLACADARRALAEDWPGRAAFLCNTIERIVLLGCTALRSMERRRRDSRILASVAWLERNFTRRTTVTELARRAHVSASRFAVLFQAEMGVAPMRFLETLRMRRAQELLLATSDPVQAIARAVGFSNPYHFSARFRHRVGQSPRAYRRNPQREVLARGDILST